MRIPASFYLPLALVSSTYVSATPHGKSPTHRLLKGGTLLVFNEAAQRVQPIVGDLLIEVRKGTIEALGRSVEIPSRTKSTTEVIDVAGHIISPGFIDTHKHGWQTAYRGLGPNTELSTYYYSYGQFGPAPFIFSAEDIYSSQLVSVYEALNAGTTSILEHAHHTWSPEHADAGFKASIDAGARSFYGYALQPTVKSKDEFVLDFGAFNWQIEQLRDWSRRKEVEEGKIGVGLAWDFMQANATEQTVEMYKLAEELGLDFITLHYHGGFFDNDVKKIALLERIGLLNISLPIIFSHATKMTEEEGHLLRKRNQHVSLTTESEMHYGMWGIESKHFLDQCALGVDTHLTFSADMLTQMRISLQAIRTQLYYPATWEENKLPEHNPMTVEQAFILGTLNGARALRRDDLGILKVGAKADIVVISTDSPALVGVADPIAAVVLHASVADIKHVLVNGEFKKKDGKLVGVDWKRVSRDFAARARRIQNDWRQTNWTVYGVGLSTQLTGFTQEDYVDVGEADVLRGEGSGYFLDDWYNPAYPSD